MATGTLLNLKVGASVKITNEKGQPHGVGKYTLLRKKTVDSRVKFEFSGNKNFLQLTKEEASYPSVTKNGLTYTV